MFLRSRLRSAVRGRARPRAYVPRLEVLEGRCVPVAGAFLHGVTFLDANLNGVLDPGESPQAGAAVTLFRKGDATALTALVTDATGRFQFDDSNVPGGLSPGTYELVETPPAGFRNVGAQTVSQINPAAVVDAKTIEVTIVDPTTLQLFFDPAAFFARNKWEFLSYTFEGNARQNTVGQFPITITANGLPPQGVSFLSFCTDLANNLASVAQTYPVVESTLPPPPADPASAGRIGYLFNHYGTQDLSQDDAVGLQLAIWRLEYGANFDNVAAIAPFTTPEQLAAAQARADFFLADSVGKNEPVTFLNLAAATPNAQGMIGGSSNNFGNGPKASPAVTTQVSATANNVVNVSILSDTATITGGMALSGTLTFTVTYPNGITTVVGTVAVNGAGTYAVPTTIVATLVGTYTFHAVYSGDANNNAAVDTGANESVTIVAAPKATPSVSTQASATEGGVGVSLLSDTATITGGTNLTGTLTFTLTAPNGTTTTVGTVAVNGAGTYAAPTTVLATLAGTFTWHVVFSGDANNNPASDNGANESVTIGGGVRGIVIPLLVTQVTSTNGVAVASGMLGDTAILTGGLNPTGTITFTLIAPDGSVASVQTVPVNGNGVYHAPTLVPIKLVGTYTWHAVYSGDAGNQTVADTGVNESIVSTPAASKRFLLASFLRQQTSVRTAVKPAPLKKPATVPIASRVAAPKAAAVRRA
jgi:hypothetical protein